MQDRRRKLLPMFLRPTEMAAARKSSRYGHRDATMILIGYRHGLRASELCDLQWSQVELTTGRLHVRRAKLLRWRIESVRLWRLVGGLAYGSLLTRFGVNPSTV